jgi:hypothetical protein
MRDEVITAETSLTVGGMTVTVLSRQSVTCSEVKGLLSFTAVKKPVYVVLFYGGRCHVLDMLSREVPIRQVKLEYPGLDEVPGVVEPPP